MLGLSTVVEYACCTFLLPGQNWALLEGKLGLRIDTWFRYYTIFGWVVIDSGADLQCCSYRHQRYQSHRNIALYGAGDVLVAYAKHQR